MRALSYSLDFRGNATFSEPGVLLARANAPSGAFRTTVDGDGVRGRFEPAPGGEATLEARLSLLDDGAFEAAGTISFGNGNALRFRSLAPGVLGPSPDAGLRHGTVVSEIEGGDGSLAGATGRISSSFLVSDTGELTDRHLAVLFVREGHALH